MSFTIKSLTALNVRALRETLTEEELATRVTVTATTATFHMDPVEALAFMTSLMRQVAVEHGTQQHPFASLRAVLRKLQAGVQ